MVPHYSKSSDVVSCSKRKKKRKKNARRSIFGGESIFHSSTLYYSTLFLSVLLLATTEVHGQKKAAAKFLVKTISAQALQGALDRMKLLAIGEVAEMAFEVAAENGAFEKVQEMADKAKEVNEVMEGIFAQVITDLGQDEHIGKVFDLISSVEEAAGEVMGSLTGFCHADASSEESEGRRNLQASEKIDLMNIAKDVGIAVGEVILGAVRNASETLLPEILGLTEGQLRKRRLQEKESKKTTYVNGTATTTSTATATIPGHSLDEISITRRAKEEVKVPTYQKCDDVMPNRSKHCFINDPEKYKSCATLGSNGFPKPFTCLNPQVSVEVAFEVNTADKFRNNPIANRIRDYFGTGKNVELNIQPSFNAGIEWDTGDTANVGDFLLPDFFEWGPAVGIDLTRPSCHAGKLCDDGNIRPCPEGNFCILNQASLCEEGYYCPPGSKSSKGRPITSQRGCTAGTNCKCKTQGKYCPRGSTTSLGEPIEDDTYIEGESVEIHGDQVFSKKNAVSSCPKGFYLTNMQYWSVPEIAKTQKHILRLRKLRVHKSVLKSHNHIY